MEPRIIEIVPMGNVGNRMIQVMAAITLQRHLQHAQLKNVLLPEWGITSIESNEAVSSAETICIRSADHFKIDEIVAFANAGKIKKIIIWHYLQQMRFFLDKSVYQEIFVSPNIELPPISNDEILINIRGGEVFDGVTFYPLIPANFYRDIIKQTGLKPVFMGQLTDNVYCNQLRSSFPEARFITSLGAIGDFALIRSAKHIIPSVSTFSWLAAWLSEAESVYLPLCGFYNPRYITDVDLLPLNDSRYRFFQFPLYYGQPVAEAMRMHRHLEGRWHEISVQQLHHLKTNTPALTPSVSLAAIEFDANCYTAFLPGGNLGPLEPEEAGSAAAHAIKRGFSASDLYFPFDEGWYVHQYPDVADDLTNGTYATPLHHYLDVGKRRGYTPIPPGMPNIAMGKAATQSSICEHSHGNNVEADAVNGINGQITGTYGFHTAEEPNPWWQVDLGAAHMIYDLFIYNRVDVDDYRSRAVPLKVYISNDGIDWELAFEPKPDREFGGRSGIPLHLVARPTFVTRYVRLTVPRVTTLHLDEIQIFGHATT